jgi:hypothetical protein
MKRTWLCLVALLALVFQVLSEIADNSAYWLLNCQYKKVA